MKLISLALWGLSEVALAAEPVMVPANAALPAATPVPVMVPANAPLPAAAANAPAPLATAVPVMVPANAAAPVTSTVASTTSAIAPLSVTAATTGAPAAVATTFSAETAVPTEAPTPVPTPTVPPELPGRSKSVQLLDPAWAVVLKAGGVLPLGDLAQYNQSGPVAGLDALYHANADYSVDIFASYSSQGYKLGGGQPLTNIGLGAKLLYNLATIDGITWYAGGGLAAYYTQRTTQVLRQPVLNNTPVFDPTNESTAGFGLVGTLGGRYEFESRWGLLLELNIANINLAGGTSDNLLLAQPVLGLSYSL